MHKKKTLLRILQVLVLFQFLSITFINFTKSYSFLNLDSSLAMRHCVEMWKNGIFLQDYNYFSTIENDNAAFLGAPIYMITHNLNLALGIAHILTFTFCIWILHDIFKNLQVSKECFLITVFLFFTPYSLGQLAWSNMFFLSVGQYEFRILVLLLLLDLMLLCDSQKYGKRKLWILTAIYSCLSLWTAISCGNYVLFMIVGPFILKAGFDILLQQKFQMNTDKNKVLIIAAITAFLGWQIHNHFAGPSHRNTLSLISAENFFKNFENCIAGIYLLFGGLTREHEISIFSIHGIGIILRFLLISFLLFLTIKELFLAKRRKMLSSYFSSFALVNLSVLMLTNSQYGSTVFEERYHILWCVLLLIICAVLLFENTLYKNIWIKNVTTYGLLLALTFINLLGFYDMAQLPDFREYETAILSKAIALDADSIYLYESPESAAVLRAQAPERYCVSIDSGLQTNTAGFYKYYSKDPALNDRSILVCSSEEFLTLPEYIRDSYQSIDNLDEQILYFSDTIVCE